MLTFIKENSYLIFRQIAIQMGMTIFGLALSLPTSVNDDLMLGCGIFAALFYLYLLADAALSVGLKEQIKIQGGRAKYQPLKGLLISLCANFLNILLALAIWVGYAVSVATGTKQAWLNVLQMIATFIQAMYAGVISYVNNVFMLDPYSFGYCLIFTLILLPAMIVTTIAYYCGERGIHIVPGYRNGKKPKY